MRLLERVVQIVQWQGDEERTREAYMQYAGQASPILPSLVDRHPDGQR